MSRAANGGWDPQAAAEAGQHAEDWLHARLTAAFPDRQMVRRERDAMNRESDFVLRFEGQSFHIEAKRVGSLPGSIYWSDLEFAKASELGESYCLAVLLPSLQGYDVVWIWQPIADLEKAERFVDWIWEGRTSEQLPSGSWEPAAQKPQKAPRSYAYRITFDQVLLDSLPKDTPDLAMLKSRLAPAPSGGSHA